MINIKSAILSIALLITPSLAYGQVCQPGQGNWTVTTTTVTFHLCNSNGTAWLDISNIGGGTVPTGLITLVYAGSCASGWEEATELNGKTLVGTLAANKDVGTTGGSDNITDIVNHTHPITDAGHTHLTQRYPTATGASSGFTIDTSMSGTLTDNTLPVKSSTTGISINNPSGGVASIDNRSAFIRVIFCRKT